MRILFFIFLFTYCCHTEDFLYSEKRHHQYLYEHAFRQWGLNLKLNIKKANDETIINHQVIVSRNLSCQETELKDYTKRCEETVTRVRENYGDVMAFCLTEHDENGFLKKTSIILNDLFFLSSRWTDNDKINVVAHELGHCLGLKHSNVEKNIMFPYHNLYDVNYYPQKRILMDYYLEGKEPQKKDEYFYMEKDNFMRHEKLPLYTIIQ